MAEENMQLSDDEPISLESDEPISLEADDAPSPPMASAPAPVVEEEPIKLSESSGESSKTQVRAFGASALKADAKSEFKRQLNVDGAGATRCKVFHSKIAIAPLHFMETQINEWLDGANVEVKEIGHVIGVMEGKKPEPNLIVLVWY